MAATELAVAVLWHMHQPDYGDPVTGRVVMPWVRLHALSSYADMARLAAEAPEARAVFNVVPTLLSQLADAAAGRGEDEFLALARAEPADLSPVERALLLKRFFAFHHARRFAELPRLAELWRKREARRHESPERLAAAFTDAELRDLQVGFHLAWSGRTLREEPRVAALLRKGRGFTAAEKGELLDLQHAFLARVMPAYRELATGGAHEVSCTPWAHPIAPLLCDTRAALESSPGLPLPAARVTRPGDAWWHVRVALDETERLLGARPRGMWPAEGALSEEAIRVFAACGVRWLASDQEVLAAAWDGAVPVGGHFQPWRWGGDGMPSLFFRDQGLSDRIGFVYAGWEGERAAADLIGHLQGIRAQLPAGRYLAAIILDGENAWEAYPAQGVDFLRAFYGGVAAAPGLRWRTLSQFLDDGGSEAAKPLPRLRAGSWIRRDLTTWIGHPEKNRAWDRLAATRDWLEPRLAAAGALREVALPGGGRVPAPDPDLLGPDGTTPLARAWRAMASAEGSDWFWWYGDDHPTEFAAEFDALFRAHLGNVYRQLGEAPPPALAASLRDTAAPPTGVPPRAPLDVTLDGRVTHYFEWLDAGRCEAGGERGAMHRGDSPLAALWYGADPLRLLLRLDPAPGRGAAALAGLDLVVHLVAPAAAAGAPGPSAAEAAAAEAAARRAAVLRLPRGADGRGEIALLPATGGAAAPALPGGACDRIAEVAVPWARLEAAPGDEIGFFITLEREGRAELRVPTRGALVVRAPRGPADADDWIV